MTDRDLMQQALENICAARLCEVNSMSSRREALRLLDKAAVALRERLAQPNEFNPDWDAMAVMVEEQQRMAKRIEELEARQEQEPGVNDWSVFNTGAEVASGLSLAEALAYLTPARLERGWSASCVIDHDNPPSTSPSAPHSADSADTFCNEPVGEIVPAFAGLTAVSIPVMPPVGTKLYTSPQRREWVGLTQQEAMQIIDTARHGSISGFGFMRTARAVEAALKARNA